MVLEAVYEQDFLPCSYGFRPGRGAHDALKTLWDQTMAMGGGWVLEGDIENFFRFCRPHQAARDAEPEGVRWRVYSTGTVSG